MTTRVCDICGTDKPMHDFGLRAGIRHLRCKQCRTAAQKESAARARICRAPALKVDAPANNPFLWRTFVQPVAGGWSAHETANRPSQKVNPLFTQYK